MISYERAKDIQMKADFITERLGFQWIDMSRVVCVRSYGSKSIRTLARCHGLTKIMQAALGVKGHYVIEVISEHFDKLSPVEQTKTLIHELMHIPRRMGGGFRHHRPWVNRSTVDRMYDRLMEGI